MNLVTILITGGLGYIGSHTTVNLSEYDNDLLIVDKYEDNNLLIDLQRLTNNKVKFLKLNLLNINDLRSLFKQHRITAVIHFAALKSLPESFENPIAYYQNNVTGTLNLIEVMQEHNVKKLVFSSSAIVYGDNGRVPLSETEPYASNNPYAKTKQIIEQVLRDIAKNDPDWSILALRYFNPIGAHPSGLIGEKMTKRSSNLMPHIIRVAAKEQPYLSVFGDTYDSHDGTCIRDYIHVMDLANGHVKALQYLEKNNGFEVINLGTGIGYSVLDLIHTFRRVNEIEVPYKIEAQRQGDIAKSYASVEKAQRLLNWRALLTLEDMCKDAWRWKVRQKE